MTPARLVALLALAAALPARAGVVIEGKEGEQAQRIVMEGQKLRMEGKDEDGTSVVVFDGETRRSVQLHPQKKTYMEITQDDLKQMAAMVKEARQRQGMPAPPEGKKATIRYEKTSRKETALGTRCDVYAVVAPDGTKDEEICLAPFGTFGVQKADLAALRAFADFTADLAGGAVDRNWADLPGVPLASWKLEGGKRDQGFRATKIEKKKVAASEFAVPAGFTKEPGFAEQMKALQEQAQPAR